MVKKKLKKRLVVKEQTIVDSKVYRVREEDLGGKLTIIVAIDISPDLNIVERVRKDQNFEKECFLVAEETEKRNQDNIYRKNTGEI